MSHMRPFGGFDDPFDDPFFASPFGMRGVPSLFADSSSFSVSSNMGSGRPRSNIGGSSSSMFTSTTSSMNGRSRIHTNSTTMSGGSSRSTSVSKSTRIINGIPQTVTITTVQDENGVRTYEDYGNGQQRYYLNGIEQRSLESSQTQNYPPQPTSNHHDPFSTFGMPHQPYPPQFYHHQATFWDH
jgi:hypothetical protein